jgi:hypothetical protein
LGLFSTVAVAAAFGLEELLGGDPALLGCVASLLAEGLAETLGCAVVLVGGLLEAERLLIAAP